MTDSLFDLPESLSPREEWQRITETKLSKDFNLKISYDKEDAGYTAEICVSEIEGAVTLVGIGKTEHEALDCLCETAGVQTFDQWRKENA